MRAWPALLVFLLLVGAAAAGAIVARPDAWYGALAKPSFNPPNAIFPPVWTVLYIAIAVAAWRVWRMPDSTSAISLWLAQLACNAAWSPLFFGLHRIDLALADIVLLVALVIATVIAFRHHDRMATWLMLPYLAWIAFATLLTFSIWRLNGAA